MFFAKRQIAAFTVCAFLGVALLCVETNRAALLNHASITSRAADHHRPPPGLKALKRSTFVENSAPHSDSARAARRYLSSQERAANSGGRFLLSLPGFIPTPKVSTSLFLSVLNL